MRKREIIISAVGYSLSVAVLVTLKAINHQFIGLQVPLVRYLLRVAKLFYLG